ncbi:hypothetical protein TRAPUB_2657 [Trametes pubescens]|uniref:Uncharacterized protein n=1 Tax=Trametes pubescens TaxID=154538 RepID=A0A1M2VG15_TRAPU|nr:hypothetical protein TRAPUB_2657 [Trametes pubescens]
MGDSCISELDFSYVAEDPHYLPPPPPEKPHLSLPDRCKVSLRPGVVPVSLPGDDDVMDIEDTSSTSSNLSFGFPVHRHDAPVRQPPTRKATSSRRKSIMKMSTRRGKMGAPSQCVRFAPPPVVAKPAEIFQSITATPGLDERSFEEMRAECYAISAITTGRPPQPVASVPEGTATPRTLMLPAFAPFVVPSAVVHPGEEQRVLSEPRDFAMSHDVSVYPHAGRLLHWG